MTSSLPSSSRHHGFTLIELLLVIGIIAILASIVVVAINPTKQLADTRDVVRRTDVRTILDAVYQYTIDHGSLPVTIPTGEDNALEICKLNAADCTGYLDLKSLSGTYLVDVPVDPQADTTQDGTNYLIFKDAGSRIVVWAINAENTADIRVTR